MRLKVLDYDAMRKAFDEKFKETRQLIEEGETHLDNLAEGFHEANNVIWSMPTIDAVPVVRCKECKHKGWIQELCHGKSVDYCRALDFCINNADKCFCYYGERKDGEG